MILETHTLTFSLFKEIKREGLTSSHWESETPFAQKACLPIYHEIDALAHVSASGLNCHITLSNNTLFFFKEIKRGGLASSHRESEIPSV